MCTPPPRSRHIDVERWLVTIGAKQADWRLEVEILPPSSHDTLIRPVCGCGIPPSHHCPRGLFLHHALCLMVMHNEPHGALCPHKKAVCTPESFRKAFPESGLFFEPLGSKGRSG